MRGYARRQPPLPHADLSERSPLSLLQRPEGLSVWLPTPDQKVKASKQTTRKSPSAAQRRAARTAPRVPAPEARLCPHDERTRAVHGSLVITRATGANVIEIPPSPLLSGRCLLKHARDDCEDCRRYNRKYNNPENPGF